MLISKLWTKRSAKTRLLLEEQGTYLIVNFLPAINHFTYFKFWKQCFFSQRKILMVRIFDLILDFSKETHPKFSKLQLFVFIFVMPFIHPTLMRKLDQSLVEDMRGDTQRPKGTSEQILNIRLSSRILKIVAIPISRSSSFLILLSSFLTLCIIFNWL